VYLASRQDGRIQDSGVTSGNPDFEQKKLALYSSPDSWLLNPES
jgi:hypothetical protein